MKQYKLVNNLMGWLVFAVAAVVYCLTIESSASFWDCPEFITTGFKLEVGHPPGAPFFMLTANLFSQLASDPSQVAYMVNVMSALLSAGCILFLFWSITHLTRRLICGTSTTIKTGQMITIIGAGLVGALAYTFSDTFWYSAVEGEVYAYSSFFTAVVFWFILKWEEEADSVRSDRWIILIAYMMGLSVGVHLLNLLCIPAIVLIYYYKKRPNAGWKGSLMALIVSAVLIAAILYGIVPGIVKVGGWFELLFVNGLSMPFNTGLIIYIVVLVAALVWSIWETYAARSAARTYIAFIAVVALTGLPFYGHGIKCVALGLVVLAALAAYLFNMDKLKEQWRMSARVMSTALVSIMMIVIGYSSYAVIVVRSSANTPMDQNSPEDIFTLGSYLNREQYGDTPLFYGGTYASKVKRVVKGQYWVPVVKEGAKVYIPKEKASPDEKDQYFVVRVKEEAVMEPAMLFPRLHSADHANWPTGNGTTINLYDNWAGGIKGREAIVNVNGQRQKVKVPTQMDNIKFFINYQVNFMYWRYFMWNFAGRQNDIQGHGELEHGNWITGIPFFDNLRLGDQSNLPTELRENKGRNVFYCLPLLLGIIGLVWQVNKRISTKDGMVDEGVKQFWVVFFLFFMTGLAIVLYLNQTPVQPRERDYAYAGSFYAYTIWIGLGVAAVARGLEIAFEKMRINNKTIPAVVASLVCLCVPLQMVSQTWDDHDRSGRYVARDFGMNYLSSVEPNAILFTNGDNDTFPLWYAQEVEGFRTDVRVCNLSYFQTDWYADQMKRPAYESEPLPISATRDVYAHDKMSYAYILPVNENLSLSATDALNFLYSKDPRTKKTQYGELNYLPTNKIYISVDSAKAVANAGMPAGYEEYVVDRISPKLDGKSGLYFYEIAALDMINTNIQQGWERPIYYAVTVSNDLYLGLEEYFAYTGLAQKVVPMKTAACGGVDTERMYDNMMNKFQWGGLDAATEENPIYLDENIRRMCQTTRVMFGNLIEQLIVEGQHDKALKALDLISEKIPSWLVPYEALSIQIANNYLTLGEYDKAKELLIDSINRSLQYIAWYQTLTSAQYRSVGDKDLHQYIMQAGLTLLYENGMQQTAEDIVAAAQANGLF